MKNKLLLLICCLSVWGCKQKSNPGVWTEKYEQGYYNYIDSSATQILPDAWERTKYVSYVVKRVKTELPNGLNSVSRDSLHNLNTKIGREYAIKERSEGHITPLVPRYEKWTPVIEKEFRDNYVAIFQSMGPGFGDKMCDCMLSNLKKFYPDSLPLPIPSRINRKLNLDCAEALKKDN